MARDSVDGAGDERARICAALVELVAARGYQSTTVDHVIELAGVEPAAFHRHFASVEECFAATWEAVDRELTGLMAAAFGRRATTGGTGSATPCSPASAIWPRTTVARASTWPRSCT